MRRPLWIAVLWAVVTVSRAQAADFPYTAYVNTANVYVRSGPGQDYYPTDKLQKGEKVEVYRHDPGGWYAIRPTRQSFSWISKRHVEPTDNGLAVVTMPRAVSRVGSSFSDVREVIQVRLDQGERVELVGQPDPESMWCKIAPPAGEFRWVFSKYVDRDYNGPIAQDSSDQRDARGASLAVSQSEGQDARTATYREDRGSSRSAPVVDEDAARSIALEQELNRIELDLSAMVAGDINNWSFEDFERRTQFALQQARTPVERGQARVLLNKLSRFEDVRQRHDLLRNSPEQAVRDTATTIDSSRVDLTRFDGVGRLAPVISEKVGGPQYALVDKTNTVVSFVTPAPGVNLRPYVDHYVGVNGQRGYLAELQRQHINVQRISLLETPKAKK